jgi:D-arabinose 1-dehydrogenase-like Zn-dependent alcohol dehydrogenase
VLDCGICHSDVLIKRACGPGFNIPRVPGREVAGIIDELGEAVSEWKTGQHVGAGWHSGQESICSVLQARRRPDKRFDTHVFTD